MRVTADAYFQGKLFLSSVLAEKVGSWGDFCLLLHQKLKELGRQQIPAPECVIYISLKGITSWHPQLCLFLILSPPV